LIIAPTPGVQRLASTPRLGIGLTEKAIIAAAVLRGFDMTNLPWIKIGAARMLQSPAQTDASYRREPLDSDLFAAMSLIGSR
jgi:hypothetical protein